MSLAPYSRSMQRDNRALLRKLAVIAVLMFGFGYALVPLYRSICEALGINVLSLSERQVTNARGPFEFMPAQRSLQVHPGELTTVMYEFRNTQNRALAAQAIPSYAPKQATAHFNKLECFCFNEYTLAPGESKQWPVVFVIDPRLPKDVRTITLSYTFFEVKGKVAAKAAEALL
jgi:cytochrome c oxidase assembly protein subunit 11